LEPFGIQTIHELQGVGANYQDHAVVYMTFEGPEHFEADWVVPKFRLIIKSHDKLRAGNFHVIMRPPAEVQGIKRMMPISAHLLEQRSRGRVRLQSADPSDLVAIDSNMLQDPEDVECMLAAMRFIHELTQDSSMSPFYGRLLQPTPSDDWSCFAQRSYESYHHGVGTCMMGPASNPMAVVDQSLRVHGFANLWVGDASIMPTVTRANTNLTTIMIGERLADFLNAV
jgi:choline dehydrogenase